MPHPERQSERWSHKSAPDLVRISAQSPSEPDSRFAGDHNPLNAVPTAPRGRGLFRHESVVTQEDTSRNACASTQTRRRGSTAARSPSPMT